MTTKETAPVVTAQTLNDAVQWDTAQCVMGEQPKLYSYDRPVPDTYMDDKGELVIEQPSTRHTWSPLTGYSRQYGYNGPIMNPSETLSGGMAQDLIDDQVMFVVKIVTDFEGDIVGWCVLALDA